MYEKLSGGMKALKEDIKKQSARPMQRTRQVNFIIFFIDEKEAEL